MNTHVQMPHIWRRKESMMVPGENTEWLRHENRVNGYKSKIVSFERYSKYSIQFTIHLGELRET